MQRWARLGGGSYFDARGGDDLGRAIARAVRPPIRVLDEAGNEVGSGTLDGKPVEVPPGTYSIVVLSDPVVRFDGVAVGPEEAVVREMPSASVKPPESHATVDETPPKTASAAMTISHARSRRPARSELSSITVSATSWATAAIMRGRDCECTRRN